MPSAYLVDLDPIPGHRARDHADLVVRQAGDGTDEAEVVGERAPVGVRLLHSILALASVDEPRVELLQASIDHTYPSQD
jgi:hypothetical protein